MSELYRNGVKPLKAVIYFRRRYDISVIQFAIHNARWHYDTIYSYLKNVLFK